MRALTFTTAAAMLCLFGSLTTMSSAIESEFDAALDQARQSAREPTGHEYQLKINSIVQKYVMRAMEDCSSSSPHMDIQVRLVLIVSRDGRVRKILSPRGQAFAACVAKTIQIPLLLPPPPHDRYAVPIKSHFQH